MHLSQAKLLNCNQNLDYVPDQNYIAFIDSKSFYKNLQCLLCFRTTDQLFFFLQGRYAGNAVGFKISSLLKLIETRANKPRMTLLHYLVDEAEKTDKHVLQFADDLKQPLTAANRSATFPLHLFIYLFMCIYCMSFIFAVLDRRRSVNQCQFGNNYLIPSET